MEQVFFGGYYVLLDDTATKYNGLAGGGAWQSVETYRHTFVSSDGIIKNLRVKLNDSPGVGNKYTFTLMVNGAPTALTFDIAGTDTSGSNMVNEIDVVSGDTVSLRCVPDSTPTERYATWTSMFEGDTAKESLLLGIGLPDRWGTSYIPVIGTSDGYMSGVHLGAPCPTSGTIKKFYVSLGTAPGAGKSWVFTLLVDGVPSALTITIADAATTGDDLVNEVAVVAGECLTIECVASGIPPPTGYAKHGFTFLADIDGESLILSENPFKPHTTNTEYMYLQSPQGSDWSVTEAERYQLGQSCILKKLYVVATVAPGAGKSWVFTNRINGGAGNLTVTITGAAATTGNDLVHTDSVSDDDYVDFESNPDNTPAEANVHWGVVGYIAPPPPVVGKSPLILDVGRHPRLRTIFHKRLRL